MVGHMLISRFFIVNIVLISDFVTFEIMVMFELGMLVISRVLLEKNIIIYNQIHSLPVVDERKDGSTHD